LSSVHPAQADKESSRKVQHADVQPVLRFAVDKSDTELEDSPACTARRVGHSGVVGHGRSPANLRGSPHFPAPWMGVICGILEQGYWQHVRV